MLCEKCKKNEARINLVKIVNGEKHEVWLCEKCAKNIADIPFLSSVGEESIFPFQGILTGLLSNVATPKIDEKNIVCHNCGLTYQEFEKSGKLGCADCYKDFREVLVPKVRNIQGEIKHIGRIPKTNGIELSRRRKLKDLKFELQKLIRAEEYEKAVIVRDQIRELETFILESNTRNDEIKSEVEKCNEQLDS